jgi:hypothetical protein
MISKSQFDSLDAIYQADAAVNWTPNDDYSHVYSVQVTKCDSAYYEKWASAGGGDTNVWRKNATIELVVLSVVS